LNRKTYIFSWKWVRFKWELVHSAFASHNYSNVTHSLSPEFLILPSFLPASGLHKEQIPFAKERVEDNLEKFIQAFEQITQSMLKECKQPRFYIDAKINLGDLTPQFVKYLSLLSPHGIGNPEPTFLSDVLEVKQSNIVNEKHLRLLVSQENLTFEAIGFNLSSLYPPPSPLQMVFVPYEDHWRGETRVKLKIQDLKSV